MELDAFDLKLLSILQLSTRGTAEELAQQVGLSPSACLRRVRRLREGGVIEAEVAVLAPRKVGRELTMVVQVALERERADIMDAFKRAMRATPEVMQCFYVTGDIDFILIVTMPSMEEYELFTDRFFFQNPNVRRFTTMVVMDRVKVGLAVPIDAARLAPT
jgi:Lrp/AsnC family transcriptional regulator, leucine-responsive regulatory protein